MRLIGDIHGKLPEYAEVIKDCDTSVQVGDFGWGFFNEVGEEYVNTLHRDGRHRFIRGNHDDPQKCRDVAVGWIADGVASSDIMYIGGAWSIDWRLRTPGISWWWDEQLSHEQFEQVSEKYNEVKPAVVITHDAPHYVASKMFFGTGLCKGWHEPSHTAMCLQRMFHEHQPALWVFGHWHHTTSITIEGTKFQCLGELDYIDI